MKKSKLAVISAALAVTVGCSVCLAACNSEPQVIEYELSAYTGYDKDSGGKTVHNDKLFYSNSLKQGYADPQVLDDTARSGYYYLYGTSNFQTMRSKDLAVWEPVKVVMDFSNTEINNAMERDRWAPEVAYDEETKLYYMFFSATPKQELSKDEAITETGGDVTGSISEAQYMMYVATSASPEGTFKVVNFNDANSCGAENVHTFNTDNNKVLTEEQAKSGDYAFVERTDKDGNKVYYEAAFRHYYAKYALFAPDVYSKFMYRNKMGAGGSNNVQPQADYFMTIDPHPFVDPVESTDEATGKKYHKKYLYFKAEGFGCNISVGVEMENWLKPKWETAKYLTASDYYTVEDWQAGTDRGVSYEYNAVCNEGQCMLYHDGKYYLTFSVNDYSTNAYQVGMAVSDSPLGTFRKLRESEGGLLLCSMTTESNSVSGAGHHSFVTAGNQLYIAYHRHKNYAVGGPARYTAIDEIKWITVKDINGQDMVIPYVNGPTDSLQPLPESISGYKNVAGDATITCTDEEAELEYLTDGLLTVHKSADETFMSYIGETVIEKTATFDFAFDAPTSVRAVMVYNSTYYTDIFRNVSRMEFTLADGSVRVIRNVKFDLEQHCRLGGMSGTDVLEVYSGTAAFAEFYDVEVTDIKITVEVPKDQDQVGIPEIRILGKA